MAPARLAAPDSPPSAAAHDCELGALDLYGADGWLIERIDLLGDRHSLAIELAHIVPRLLASSCQTVVLHHYHPSGIGTPSETDLHATRAFAGLLSLLGMRLHDHIIAGHDTRFSFRAHGLI